MLDTFVINGDYMLLIMLGFIQLAMGLGVDSPFMFAIGVAEIVVSAVLTSTDKPNFSDTSKYQSRLMGDTAMGYICSGERPVQNKYVPGVEAVFLLLALLTPASSIMIAPAKVAAILGHSAVLLCSLLRWQTDVYWVSGMYRYVRIWYQRKEVK